MRTKLDSFERRIERASDRYRPVSKSEQRKIETILQRVRKAKTVNIRIAEQVLEELKRRSRREGLPYQTLISSILYKYVTDSLVDEETIRKSLRLLDR